MRQQQHSSILPEQNWCRSLACSPTTPLQLINTRAFTFVVATRRDHPGNITTRMFRLKNTAPLGMLRGAFFFVLPGTQRRRPFTWHLMIPMFSRAFSRSSSQAQGYFLSRGVRTPTSDKLRALCPTSRTDLLHYLKRTGCDSQRE